MFYTYIFGEIVKFKGHPTTLYIANSNRNLKDRHLTGCGRNSVKEVYILRTLWYLKVINFIFIDSMYVSI